MTLKIHLWLTGLASILALVSFVAIMAFFTPQNASIVILILLFFSLFLSLCGLFSLIALYLRRRKNKLQEFEHLVSISFREGTLLSLLLVGFLLMRIFNVFYWWIALIFLIIVVAIEAVFISQENK
jgi:archaellum biogenesis protein FlaJ (TadC family)